MLLLLLQSLSLSSSIGLINDMTVGGCPGDNPEDVPQPADARDLNQRLAVYRHGGRGLPTTDHGRRCVPKTQHAQTACSWCHVSMLVSSGVPNIQYEHIQEQIHYAKQRVRGATRLHWCHALQYLHECDMVWMRHGQVPRVYVGR